MKLLIAVIALVSFGIFAPKSYADPVLSVNAGVTGGTLVETQVANVFTWVYADTAATLYNPIGVTDDNNVFTAVFTYVPLGVSVLNVTDVCANVGILHAATPCNLDFSFSDTSLGLGYMDGSNTPALLGNLDIALGANIDISVLDGVIGGVAGNPLASADIGGGTGQIDFAPTPEPGTLGLMGTGLLGVAGMVRRKLRMA